MIATLRPFDYHGLMDSDRTMGAEEGGGRFFVFLRRHRSTALLLFVLLTLIAGVRVLSLPEALYPSIDFPRISVIVSTQDLPFSQMSVRVTRPVSVALRGIAGVREVRSRTSRGSAQFFVRFDWNTPMVLALSRVNQAIARVAPDLPPGTRSRAIRMISADTPVLQIALTSRTRSLSALTDLARYRLLPFLVNVSGVWKVEVVGSMSRELHVEVNPYELAGAGKTLPDVLAALPAHNRTGVVGRLSEYHQIALLEVHNALSGPDAVRRLFLPGAGQAPLPLSQVARVRWGTAPADALVRVAADGSPAVLLNVYRAHGESALAVVSRIDSRKATFLHLLPPGVDVLTTYDQGHVIGQAILHVAVALLVGMAAAFAVILLFLRRVRPFLLVATFVPMILVMTLGALSFLHQSINLLTLGGLAAGTGLVIDDFVVVLEGANRIRRLVRPFLFSSLATMVVLIPLFDLGGLAGAFFRPLALTLLLLLLVSLLVNIFLTPSFAAGLSVPGGGERPGQESEGRPGFFSGLMGRVRQVRWVALLALVLVVSGGALFRNRLPTNFMPRMDEGAFLVDIHAPPGTSVEDSDRAFSRIERFLATLPEVRSTSRRLGAEMGFYITEPTKGDIIVRLRDRRSRSVFAVIDQVRAFVRAKEPELEVDFPQILEDSLNDLVGTEAPVVLHIHGADRSVMERAVPAVEGLLGSVPGIVDVARSSRPVPTAYRINVRSEVAAAYHVDPAQVIANLRTGLWGTHAGFVMEGSLPRPLRVLESPEPFKTLEGIRRFPVETPSGLIPLSRLARIAGEPFVSEEDDTNLAPVISIAGRISGADLGSVTRRLDGLLPGLALPPSVWVDMGGYALWQKKSFRDLSLALGGAALLAIGVIYAMSRRAAPPLLLLGGVFFSVLLALLALAATGHSLNLSSFVGLVLVAGITAENGLLVVDRALSGQGSAGERFVLALADRWRPLLMTHAANALALLPLAVGTGAGLDMERSFAIAVMGGLAGSLVVSTLLLPLLGAGFFARSFERAAA
ncbi:MAG: efflux RND transporter permease subunit [Leptospirales bacterium]